jgi:hypothetical protein
LDPAEPGDDKSWWCSVPVECNGCSEVKLVSKSVDLSVELPGVWFIEGSTIGATVRATAERDVTVEGGRAELVRTMSYRYTAWSPTPARSPSPPATPKSSAKRTSAQPARSSEGGRSSVL